MPLSKLPKALRRGVKVGPYTVPFDPQIDQLRLVLNEPSTLGYFDSVHMCITIDPTLPPQVLRVVAWHEVKHACDHLGGLRYEDKLEEEQYVTYSAPHEVHFIQENKVFMAWIGGKDE